MTKDQAHLHAARLPRTLLLWWSLWLLAAWALAFGLTSPFFPNLRAYESNVRHLMVLVVIGIAVIWPLFRLSARIRSAPRITVFIDWLALIGTLQVVLWPMRVSGQWSVERLLALDWAFAAWSLIVAGVLALGVTRRPHANDRIGNRLMLGRRWFWMLVCLALSIVGPLLAILIEQPHDLLTGDELELFLWSPIAMVWSMSGRTLDNPTDTEWLRLSFITLAGLCLWVGVALLPQAGKTPRKRRPSDSPGDRSPKVRPQPD